MGVRMVPKRTLPMRAGLRKGRRVRLLRSGDHRCVLIFVEILVRCLRLRLRIARQADVWPKRRRFFAEARLVVHFVHHRGPLDGGPVAIGGVLVVVVLRFVSAGRGPRGHRRVTGVPRPASERLILPDPSDELAGLDIPEPTDGMGAARAPVAGARAPGNPDEAGWSSELVNSAPSAGLASRWSTLIVCVTSAAQRKCASRFWMRSKKIFCV